MTARVPLVLGSDGLPQQLQAGDTVAGVSASGLGLSTVEQDLGFGQMSGSFTFTAGSGLTVGKPVSLTQAVGPYTGKGDRADEAEMDRVTASGAVTSTTQITVYWQSQFPVSGNFKFNYFIGT